MGVDTEWTRADELFAALLRQEDRLALEYAQLDTVQTLAALELLTG